MNTFRKGGLFTDMKMNTTANFHIQMPAYGLPYKKYGLLKRKNPVFLLSDIYIRKQNECGIIDYP